MPTTMKKAKAPNPAALRKLADGLQKAIVKAYAPRETNTPRKQSMAQSARIEGDRLTRVQEALRALATAHEQGTCPEILADISTKAAILGMVTRRMESRGYYDRYETDEYHDNSDKAILLRNLVQTSRSAADVAARQQREEIAKLQAMEERIRFLDLPGFFPTPPEVCQILMRHLDLRDNQVVLEPSAGKGDLAQYVRGLAAASAFKNVRVICVEQSHALIEILQAKKLEVWSGDFLLYAPADRFDRIIANPPFEKGQDAAHVQYMYELLKPGGILVSVMSKGPFFRQEKKMAAFREWFESVNGYKEDLPEKAFAGKDAFRQTGTSSCFVVIRKEAT